MTTNTRRARARELVALRGAVETPCCEHNCHGSTRRSGGRARAALSSRCGALWLLQGSRRDFDFSLPTAPAAPYYNSRLTRTRAPSAAQADASRRSRRRARAARRWDREVARVQDRWMRRTGPARISRTCTPATRSSAAEPAARTRSATVGSMVRMRMRMIMRSGRPGAPMPAASDKS